MLDVVSVATATYRASTMLQPAPSEYASVPVTIRPVPPTGPVRSPRRAGRPATLPPVGATSGALRSWLPPSLDKVQEVNSDPSEVLRRSGLRVTAQRLAVLRAVSDAPHATADVVAGTVRGEIGSISIQAVYDALATLTEKGLLRRIQPAGSPARYENRVGDNHHHVICRVCDRMVDVDCAVGDPPCLTAVEDFGYQIDEA